MPIEPSVPSSVELRSEEDLSVNFVLANGQEARYVRRTDDYFIVYLSSHNGCNKACRFCHLTQSGQTSFDEASLEDMLTQAALVLDHYHAVVSNGEQAPAQRVHFNWMARGEPLASSVVTKEWDALTAGLAVLARNADVHDFRFNISSIFPAEVSVDLLLDMGKGPHKPVLFYSLYSLDPQFRKRWLPKARPALEVLAELAQWQKATSAEVVLHWALIQGENDSVSQTAAIVDAIGASGLTARFNLVRYNPFAVGQGVEASEPVLHARFAELSQVMAAPGSRIVPRVGFDVKASCGMFVLNQV